MSHSPGTAILFSGSVPRYHLNQWCWEQLDLPPGSKKLHQVGLELAHNINQGLAQMTGDWAFLMGDDHVFGVGLLVHMLDRMAEGDLDVLVPLVLRKYPPYANVLYGPPLRMPDGHSELGPVDLLGKTGLVEVHAAGDAGMLIHKRVLERLEKPWFRVGQYKPDHYQEDISFCERVRQVDCRVWCDTTVAMGHIAQVTVWPHVFPNGRRGATLALGSATVITVDPNDLAVGAAVGVI